MTTIFINTGLKLVTLYIERNTVELKPAISTLISLEMAVGGGGLGNSLYGTDGMFVDHLELKFYFGAG